MKKFLFFLGLLNSLSFIFAGGEKQDKASMKDTDEKLIFRVAASMPSSFDPSKATGEPFARIYAGLFHGLFINDPKTALPLPGLAESWEVSEDGTIYTFFLRENLKWSDGVELTAEDFVYSWRRILDPETASNFAWFPASVVKGGQDALDGKIPPEEIAVRALDKRRFQVEFVSALPYITDMLTHYTFGALPQHTIEEYGDDWVKPENYVSSGAYMMSDWRQNEYIKLVANPYFFDQSQIALDEIQFLVIQGNETAYSMYLGGEVDWLMWIPSSVFEEIEDKPYAHIDPYLGVLYYDFNTEKPPFDDLRVRKALAISFDKRALTEDVTKAGYVPSNSIVPPMAGYDESFPYEAEKLQANIAEAQQLLAEAGYPNGEGFPVVEILGGSGTIAVFLQEQWRVNLGIETQTVSTDWKVKLERQASGDFQITSAGWIGDYRDPSSFLDVFVSNGELNSSNFNSPKYDELLEKARFSSGAERFDYLKEAEAILVNDYPSFTTYFYVSTNMIDLDKWDGWYPNIMNRHHFIHIKPKK